MTYCVFMLRSVHSNNQNVSECECSESVSDVSSLEGSDSVVKNIS